MRKAAFALLVLCACGRSSATSVLVLNDGNHTVEDARIFTLRLLDDNGAPVAGQKVDWSVTGDSNHVIPYADRTDSNGFAQAWFSTTVAEPKTVRVNAGDVSLEQDFVVTAGTPGWYTSIATDMPCGKADGETPLMLIAHARDLYANPTPGLPVVFMMGSRALHIVWAQSASDTTGTALASITSTLQGDLPVAVRIDGWVFTRTVCFN